MGSVGKTIKILFKQLIFLLAVHLPLVNRNTSADAVPSPRATPDKWERRHHPLKAPILPQTHGLDM